MSITTKTGDKGKTSLYQGKRVAKDHLRMEVCGCLDELNSYLGFSKCLTKSKSLKKIIESFQKDLFIIGAEVVTENKFSKQLKQRIDAKGLKRLEEVINQVEGKPQAKFCFHLPGGSLLSSSLDISRTKVRKLERRVVTLNRKKSFKNKFVLVYLNRLSDLLFLLARKTAKESSKKR